MSSMLRKVIKIDEKKCNGCGLCAPSCAEGAIQIIDGKARLVSETYCDGLGACLGECPQGALTVEEREADEFDPEAVEQHLGRPAPVRRAATAAHATPHACPGSNAQVLRRPEPSATPHACPGSMARMLERSEPAGPATDAQAMTSSLGNWPVQLSLAPIRAPYFDGARLCVAADCVPFAFADFHRQFLSGRTLVIGCPKLDSTEIYRQKVAEIFGQNDIRSIDVVYMEVPCCFGLVQLVRLALADSGKDIPLTLTKVGIRGNILEEQ
jgi:Pyruvate/2-oxoacid:ferredoxin oxidoreductase delta subunit